MKPCLKSQRAANLSCAVVQLLPRALIAALFARFICMNGMLIIDWLFSPRASVFAAQLNDEDIWRKIAWLGLSAFWVATSADSDGGNRAGKVMP